MAPYVTNTYAATIATWLTSIGAFWYFSKAQIVEGFTMTSKDTDLLAPFVATLVFSSMVSIALTTVTLPGKRKRKLGKPSLGTGDPRSMPVSVVEKPQP
ncbi:MAG: hypothetical protein HY826_03985 [Actinobacteria bacterium]|nr:hypothetical protein [Actinomycetota bacterium]